MSQSPVVYARLLLCAALVAVLSPPPAAQEPRFRGGTNLVRLDVYVSQAGVAVTDLKASDFEVLEDNAPQQVSAFELIRARAAGAGPAGVEPSTVAEMRSRTAQPDTRTFVLFLDTLHVQLEGSSRAASPVGAMLDRIVGPDDLIGVMTPEMSASNMTFSPRTSPIAEMMRASWAWGERGRRDATDPREQDLRACYPDVGDTAGIAEAVIARRRERKTLQGLGDLVGHLEGLREERSFVLMLTEGWLLPLPDEHLARVLRGTSTGAGGSLPVGVTPDGRLGTGVDPAAGPMTWCERERSVVALTDLSAEFRLLLQRANRANVSFYPIDPRGLVVFDAATPAASTAGPSLVADARGLRQRQDGLRTLADETDGTVVLNSAIDRALPRLLTDIGSYYLLGYTSTNPKADGRYRRLTVRVKRPGVDVRARPGYLAPTAAELRTSAPPAAAQPPRAASGDVGSSDAPRGSSVGTALSRLPVSRRAPPIHVLAAGGRGDLHVVVELDRTTATLPEWAKGGSITLEVQPADGAAGRRVSETVALAAGDRVHALHLPGVETLRPGRYQVRVQATADGGRSPITVSTVVDVPGPAALIGSGLVASRRGPGTGRVFEPTADPRFRRTERLALEVPRLAEDVVVAGRLLNRSGQVLQVPVTVSERQDERQRTVAAAEVSLAPLAAGEYVLEVTGTRNGQTVTLSYALRVVT